MKKLLPLLLFLLPIITIAQESSRSWSKSLPHGFQVLATQDGHFMVLGSRTEAADEVETHTPYLARYSADGKLVYERYYSRASATSMQATKMDLMGSGDLWVTGTATKADGSEQHLLSRINPSSGDTLYMRLFPNMDYASLDFYLQPTPTGDRFYKVSFPHGGDIMHGTLDQITEDFEPMDTRETKFAMDLYYGRLHPFSASSPTGEMVFVDTENYALGKVSPVGCSYPKVYL